MVALMVRYSFERPKNVAISVIEAFKSVESATGRKPLIRFRPRVDTIPSQPSSCPTIQQIAHAIDARKTVTRFAIYACEVSTNDDSPVIQRMEHPQARPHISNS